MDPLSIASTAFALLKPYLEKGLGKISEESGKDLWNAITSLFKKNKKEEVTNALEQDSSNSEKFELAIKEMSALLSADTKATKEFEDKIREIASTQVINNSTNAALFRDISGSTVSIAQNNSK
jgi:hypothetical protein